MHTQRALKFIILIIVLGLLLATAAILAWAALESSNPSTGTSLTGNATNTSAESANSNTSSALSVRTIPDGWHLLEDEATTGISWALPTQDGYTAKDVGVDVAISSRAKPKQWYVERFTNFEGKKADVFGLQDTPNPVNVTLVNSPDRISLSSFACGGLCAGQNIISIHKDAGNTNSLSQLIEKLAADQSAITATTNGDVTFVKLSENRLSKWGYEVAYFQIRELGLIDEQEYSYFLFSTGSSAYSVMYQGSNVAEINLVLNTLEFPTE